MSTPAITFSRPCMTAAGCALVPPINQNCSFLHQSSRVIPDHLISRIARRHRFYPHSSSLSHSLPLQVLRHLMARVVQLESQQAGLDSLCPATHGAAYHRIQQQQLSQQEALSYRIALEAKPWLSLHHHCERQWLVKPFPHHPLGHLACWVSSEPSLSSSYHTIHGVQSLGVD
nr:hypothetical protein ACMD2_03749 [Ipomoea trifida]